MEKSHPREGRRKNYLVQCPNEPVFVPSMVYLVYCKKKAGGFTAYVQLTRRLVRWQVAELFPGATYAEAFTSGYTRARSTVFGRADDNDGLTVTHGTPVYRGVSAKETFEQAEARRARQQAKCKALTAATKRKLGDFVNYLPHKKRKASSVDLYQSLNKRAK